MDAGPHRRVHQARSEIARLGSAQRGVAPRSVTKSPVTVASPGKAGRGMVQLGPAGTALTRATGGCRAARRGPRTAMPAVVLACVARHRG